MEDENEIKTVLLVEDDDAHLELITSSFERNSGNYRILTARSIKEAAAVINDGGIDLIISDYKLSDGLGEELIQTAGGAFPIVIMTSHGSEHLAVEMLKTGALDYIVKSPQTFLEMPHIAARALREWSHIDGKKKAAEALIKNAESYRALIEASGDILLRFDRNYKITYASRTIDKYFDGSQANPTAKFIDEVGFHDKTADFLKANIDKVFKTKKNIETELEVHFERRNESKIFEFRFFAELDISGDILSVISVARDITERKKHEEELKKARDEAEAANVAKTMFLANMSHEIRTPMNGIMGFTELLAMSELDGDQKEFVDLISLSSAHLLEIINDILDFSKIETGKLKLFKQPFDIKEMIKKLFGFFNAVSKNKELKLKYEIDTRIEESYTGDPLRINQILTNLLSNAIKFTNAGEVIMSLNEEARGESISIIKITVTDTGIGIAADKINEIFENFHQLENSYTKKYAGIELGLSIAKNLIQLMNGEITVNSTPGVGSSFFVTLPLERRVSESIKITGGESEFYPAASEAGVKNFKNKILIAEDDYLNQRLLIKLFKDRGYKADIANNGLEALKFYESGDYSLILMDIQMPELDGLSAIKTIREREAGALKRTPIIAVTAFALKHQLDEFIAAGADDYISKPFDIKEFWTKLNNFIDK